MALAPEKMEEIVSTLSALTILEVADLVKKLEEKWGVSAAAPMMVAGAAAAPGSAAAPVAAPEKEDFDVVLTSSGDKKIQVIKVVRELTGLGLKEAKDLVDGAPKTVKEAVPKAEAESIKQKLEEAGGTIELR